MRYYLAEFVVVLVLAVIQRTWVPQLRIYDEGPALVIAFVTLVGLFRGPQEGAWTGFAGAFVLGSLMPDFLGGYFVGYLACGFLAGMLGHQLFPDRISVLLGTVFVAALAASLVRLLFVPPPLPIPYLLSSLVSSAYAAAIAAPLALLLRLFIQPRFSLQRARSPLSDRWRLKQ